MIEFEKQEQREEKEEKRKILIPKDLWIYCKVGEFTCYENVLYSENLWVKFDEPILSISVDGYILTRLKSEVVLLTKDGKILWKKKMKSTAICHKGEVIAVAEGKKLVIFDAEGKKIVKKKFKAKITSLDISDGIVVGTERGICFFKDGEILWELPIENVTLVRAGEIIIAAREDEIIALTSDGVPLWHQKFENIVYDVELNGEIKIHTLGHLVTLTLDGKISSVVKEDIERFLPLPWITVRRELEKLKENMNLAKKLKIREIKRDFKKAKKLFKEYRFREAYEIIKEANEKLRELQFQILIPKRVILNKNFHITLRFYNFFDEAVENISVDLTDLENYFEIEERSVGLPPIKRGMFIEREITAKPKYEGLFSVTVEIKCNLGKFEKRFKIRVKKGFLLWNITKLMRRGEEKKEESLLDLLK